MAKESTHASAAEKVAIGAGIATLAAAAAGALFLYGTDTGKKKRKQVQTWGLRMKADILDKMENMKELSEEGYYTIVDSVADKYKNVKNVDATEITSLVQDLRKHWKAIKSQIQPKPKARRKSTARTSSKTKE